MIDTTNIPSLTSPQRLSPMLLFHHFSKVIHAETATSQFSQLINRTAPPSLDVEEAIRKYCRHSTCIYEGIMAVRVGINGFGRIGRNVLRASINEPGLDFVAINDITDAKTLAHLLQYDSIHGRLNAEIKAEKDALIVNGKRIQILQERAPANLPWKALNVDIVLECSGLFTDRDQAAAHLTAGAKKVLVSAPSKGADITLCYGVNHTTYDAAKHQVISNASCTTNCLAPLAKVLHDSFGIKRVYQRPTDSRSSSLRHSARKSCGIIHDPNEYRCSPCRWRSVAATERQA
jgi:Glyceraldehyde 3-phosphate dehydrogenase, NAD binding domain